MNSSNSIATLAAARAERRALLGTANDHAGLYHHAGWRARRATRDYRGAPMTALGYIVMPGGAHGDFGEPVES